MLLFVLMVFSDARGGCLKRQLVGPETAEGGPFDLSDVAAYLEGARDSFIKKEEDVPEHLREKWKRPEESSVIKCDVELLAKADANFVEERELKWLVGLHWPEAFIDNLPLGDTRVPVNGTVILIVLEKVPEGTSQRWHVKNLLCSLKRLGLSSRTIIMALDESAKDLSESFDMITWYDEPSMREITGFLSDLTDIYRENRMAKQFGALAILEHGRNVLVVDADTNWLQDPIPYLERLGTDMAASTDQCPYEMNSGFLFYRATEGSRATLRTSLGYQKNPWLETDNDQYLLNCALAYNQIYNDVTFFRIPKEKTSYHFNHINGVCFDKSATLPEENLFVWHSGLFEDMKRAGNQMFLTHAMFGNWHMDGDDKCIEAPFTAADYEDRRFRILNSCMNGGTIHPKCRRHKGVPRCPTRVQDAREILRFTMLENPDAATLNFLDNFAYTTKQAAHPDDPSFPPNIDEGEVIAPDVKMIDALVNETIKDVLCYAYKLNATDLWFNAMNAYEHWDCNLSTTSGDKWPQYNPARRVMIEGLQYEDYGLTRGAHLELREANIAMRIQGAKGGKGAAMGAYTARRGLLNGRRVLLPKSLQPLKVQNQ